MTAETVETVTAAQRGDVRAFGALVDRWGRVAVAVAVARTGRPELGAEVAQEALLDAWRLLPSLREPAAFGAWLRRIVVKHADRVTRGARPHLSLDEGWVGDEPHLDARLDLDASWRAVRSALNTLQPHLREVVALFYLSDRSHAEIAALLGVSAAAVKKRLHDARRRLAVPLEVSMTPSEPSQVSRTVRAFLAARTGRVDLLTELLDADPTLVEVRRSPDPEEVAARYAPVGATLVHEAMAHGRCAALELLLDRGAALDAHGGGLLAHAVELGRADVVELLLARGADPRARMWHGGTALHTAARRGVAEVYDRLVAAGCDPGEPDLFGRTAADWRSLAGAPRPVPIGRVVDARGRPLDGGPPLEVPARSVHPPDPRLRETGIKAIDLLAPLPRAGVVHLVGGPNVGKIVLIGELGRSLGPTVIAGLLDRTLDVRDFEAVLRELGNWDRAVVVLGTGPEDHGDLVRTALALAESRGGWVVADDRLDRALRAAGPAVPVLTFGPHVHLPQVPELADRIVLDPARAARREFPAIDVASSRTTTSVDPGHHQLAEQVRSVVAGGGEGADQLCAWLTQPFAVAEEFNGRPGVRVPLAVTLRDAGRLSSGEVVGVDGLRYVAGLDQRGSWPHAPGAWL